MDREQLLETLYEAARKILYEKGGVLHPFEVIGTIQVTLQFNGDVFGGPDLSPFEIWALLQVIATEALNPYDEV